MYSRWGYGQTPEGQPVKLTKGLYEQLILKAPVPRGPHSADCLTRCSDCNVLSCTEFGMMADHPEFIAMNICDICLDDVCEKCWGTHACNTMRSRA